jgi:hypothetical protein
MGADCTNRVATVISALDWYTFKVGGRGNLLVPPTNKETWGRQMRRTSIMHCLLVGISCMGCCRDFRVADRFHLLKRGSREATDNASEGGFLDE